MALIGLPQESRYPSYLSIDLYSTSLNLRFVSAQKSAEEFRPLLNCPDGEVSAQKVTGHGSFGLWSYTRRQCRVQVCGGFVVAGGRHVSRSEQQILSYEPRWAP
jgi:hypothetical protein